MPKPLDHSMVPDPGNSLWGCCVFSRYKDKKVFFLLFLEIAISQEERSNFMIVAENLEFENFHGRNLELSDKVFILALA